MPVERSVDAEGVEIGVPSSEGRGVRSSERCRRRMMRTSDGKRRSNLGWKAVALASRCYLNDESFRTYR